MRFTVTPTVTIPPGQPLSNEQIMQAIRGLAVGVAAGSVTFADLANYVLVCPSTLADLKAVVTSDFAPRAVPAFVRGGAAVGDGGEGVFVWDNSWAGSDDGANIIIPTYSGFGGTGRWRRITPPMSFYLQAAAAPEALPVFNGDNANVVISANKGIFLCGGAATADFSISGIVASYDGREITLINNTAYVMIVMDNALSTPANQFKLSGNGVSTDVSLQPGDAIRLIYSTAALRWLRA